MARIFPSFSYFYRLLKRIIRKFQKTYSFVLVTNDITPEHFSEVENRLQFYVPTLSQSKKVVVSNLPRSTIFDGNPILLFRKEDKFIKALRKIRPGIFYIDYRNYPMDGWEWIYLANYCSDQMPDYHKARMRFKAYLEELKKHQFNKCYLFGTGPSLSKALEKDWSDGYRIVCNTIVRDPYLWKQLNPHFIVAGDAIYHFGHTSFARAFRKDLIERIQETQTYFIYPGIFDQIAQREFSQISQRLIPIPIGSIKKVDIDLTQHFVLPELDNVLSLLLLPLGCTLSKNIYLWGFDGRAPNDQLFWKNSIDHTYPDLIPDLQKAHPRFFGHFVPDNDPYKYIRQVHGDLLDSCLCSAERDGYKFVMMHNSYTPTLQKRFVSEV